MPELSEYEIREAEKVVAHRRAQLARPVGRAGGVVNRAGKAAMGIVHKVPGADQALELAGAGYEQAVKGLAKALTTSARLSLSDKALIRRFTKHDQTIGTFADISRLDLEVIDQVRPRSLSHRYAIGTGVEGAAGGLLMGGGAILAAGGAVFGAGAGAAPGMGVAAGVFAADTATVLVASTRLCLQVGSYYGYNPHDESEQLFAGAVINVATVGGTAAKNAAYVDLFRLTNMLARGGTWAQLGHSVLTKILRPLFQRLALRFIKIKLGQIVPVAGIVVGAGMNYAMLDRVGDAAHWAYRQRFLHDKGFAFDEPGACTPGSDPLNDDGDSESSDDDHISVVQIVEDSDKTDDVDDQHEG